MQKSRSARLDGLSNAWRRWWSTKRRGKPTMGAWIAGERIHADAKNDYGVVTHDGPIRGGISNLYALQQGTGMVSFFFTLPVKR